MRRRPALTTRLSVTNLEDRLTPAGWLDPGFGVGGLAKTGVVSSKEWVPGQQIAALPGGGMLVAGESTDFRVSVARLKPDGTPDAAFGTAGVVTLGEEFYTLSGVAAGPGGTVYVLTSTVSTPASPNSFLQVVRLTASGDLDTSFDGDGSVQLGHLFYAVPGSLGVLPGGGVVVGNPGISSVSGLTAEGTPSPIEGVLLAEPAGVTTLAVASMFATADGGLVLVSKGYRNGGPEEYAMVTRLTAAGQLDAAYGTGGRVAVETPGGVSGSGFLALGLDAAGGLLLARTGSYTLFLGPITSSVVRVTPAGQLDAAFAGDGSAETDGPGGLALTGGGVLSDGRIVLVGENPNGTGLVARVLAADGSADAGFADGGWLTVTGGPLADYRPVNAHTLSTAIVLADGRVAVLGATGPSDASELAVAVLSLTAETPAGGVYVAPVVVPLPPYTPPEPPVGGEPAGPTIDVPPAAPPGVADPVAPPPRESKPVLAETQGIVNPPDDFDGDFVSDKVVIAGSTVSVVSGKDGSVLLKAFAPFEASYTGTLNAVLVRGQHMFAVPIANSEADYRRQLRESGPALVVSPGQGGGPVVAVYNRDGSERGRFWGIDDVNFRGGVNLATAANGLIVMAGEGGGPRVAIFDATTLGANARRVRADFFAFEPEMRSGVVATVAGDTVVFGAGPGAGPRVRGVDARSLSDAGFQSLDDLPASARKFDKFVGDPAARTGVNLSVRRTGAVATEANPRVFLQQVTAAAGTNAPEVVHEFDEDGYGFARTMGVNVG